MLIRRCEIPSPYPVCESYELSSENFSRNEGRNHSVCVIFNVDAVPAVEPRVGTIACLVYQRRAFLASILSLDIESKRTERLSIDRSPTDVLVL